SGECYCGNTINAGSAKVAGITEAATGCNMLCNANALEYCGGPNRLNMYQHRLPLHYFYQHRLLHYKCKLDNDNHQEFKLNQHLQDLNIHLPNIHIPKIHLPNIHYPDFLIHRKNLIFNLIFNNLKRNHHHHHTPLLHLQNLYHQHNNLLRNLLAHSWLPPQQILLPRLRQRNHPPRPLVRLFLLHYQHDPLLLPLLLRLLHKQLRPRCARKWLRMLLRQRPAILLRRWLHRLQ
ncbi:MAG: hypothetical protein L6R42_011338, partial [Xanthoria sp. 1 TBL-2021]